MEQHTPTPERLLRELGDLRPGWREGACLPTAVRMLAGALKRALRPETDGDRNGVDAYAGGALPRHHDDPFDRVLVAQATAEGLIFVTRDPRTGLYGVGTLAA